jgi:hypothetical protein
MILENAVGELTGIIRQYSERFSEISDADLEAKPVLTKWSRKEVIGHLIDSSQNNLRRFITSQYEPAPPNIVYEQDFWVTANNYNKMPNADIIGLWRMLNERIVAVLSNMPDANRQKQCTIGGGSLVTLEWLAQDYVAHLKHHVNQIIPASFDIRYPQL